jgi:hypothetical protein
VLNEDCVASQVAVNDGRIAGVQIAANNLHIILTENLSELSSADIIQNKESYSIAILAFFLFFFS